MGVPSPTAASERRCVKCILPGTYRGIEFDEQGVCSVCNAYQPKDHPLGKDALTRELAKHVSTGKYDAVVPLSGGKDSTYILYHAVKEMKLRCLAVRYDSGYQVDLAARNVENTCRALQVPLVVVKSPGTVQDRLLRAAIRVSRRYGRRFMTCGNCEALLRTVAARTAIEHGAPVVLWGSSPIETTSLVVTPDGVERRPSVLLLVARKLLDPRRLWLAIRLLPSMIRYGLVSVEQRLRMRVPFPYCLMSSRIVPFAKFPVRFIHYYHYIAWDSIAQMQTLKDELGWDHPPGKDVRFDCILHSFGNYAALRTLGISSDGVSMCRFIREGKLGREEALAREARIRETAEQEARRVVQSLGMDDPHKPLW